MGYELWAISHLETQSSELYSHPKFPALTRVSTFHLGEPMIMTMRWYGPTDQVPLRHIRQVPGVTGIVGALYDVPMGEVWSLEKLQTLKSQVEADGLKLEVIESIPIPEPIKIGLPERDFHIERYIQSMQNAAAVGVKVICYNFMPIFDWTRTDFNHILPDGSSTVSFEQDKLDTIDLSDGAAPLPGWAKGFGRAELEQNLAHYKNVSEEKLLKNLIYFLEQVVPVAEKIGVKLAIHPDDPPWSIFGLPRIVGGKAQLEQIFRAVPSIHNGLTFCSGSLGSSPSNDLPSIIRAFGERIHFVHARNVLHTADKSFLEVAHPTQYGSVNMRQVMRALVEVGFTGPIRSDHGRMIWDEQGRPAYGLFDRALGMTYLLGLVEALRA